MPSKFAEFLAQKKIDQRRLVGASYRIERLTFEDRQTRLKKRSAGAAAPAAKDAAEQPKPQKSRSGRPISDRLLGQALKGETIPGPAKTRLLRAINRILQQKKQDPVDLRAIF